MFISLGFLKNSPRKDPNKGQIIMLNGPWKIIPRIKPTIDPIIPVLVPTNLFNANAIEGIK